MRLSRPYVPLAVREAVLDRQLAEAGVVPTLAAQNARSVRRRVQYKLEELFAGVQEVELHHRPALCNRLKKNIHGSHWTYEPDANDPDYLIYLPADDHNIETRVRGPHGDYSDLAKARKRKRIEKKKRCVGKCWWLITRTMPCRGCPHKQKKQRKFKYRWGKRKLRRCDYLSKAHRPQMYEVEAEPGQSVHDFALEILAQAKRLHITIHGKFNQHTLEARPHMTVKEVLQPWNDFQCRSYLSR